MSGSNPTESSAGAAGVKYAAELDYWRQRWAIEGGRLHNAHFKRLMLGLAGESDQEFLKEKIVADFGCGPRGSLCWATQARLRIGLDVLAASYMDLGLREHNTCYVVCSESSIPLPDNYVDVLFSINALDHVENFASMCRELHRIVVPGGRMLASLNLLEPASVCEPQTLTEELIKRELLAGFRVVTSRLAPRGPAEDTYRYCFEVAPPGLESATPILWVVAEKL